MNNENMISADMEIKMEIIKFEMDEHGNHNMFVKIPIGFDARWDKIKLKTGDVVCLQGQAWKRHGGKYENRS